MSDQISPNLCSHIRHEEIVMCAWQSHETGLVLARCSLCVNHRFNDINRPTQLENFYKRLNFTVCGHEAGECQACKSEIEALFRRALVALKNRLRLAAYEKRFGVLAVQSDSKEGRPYTYNPRKNVETRDRLVASV